MTVQQVFNDFVSWIEKSPSDGSPINVVAFQWITMGEASTVDYAYGTFDSVKPVLHSEPLLTGAFEFTSSNLYYSATAGRWLNLYPSPPAEAEVMHDSGSKNASLQFATDHLALTTPDGLQFLLYSDDERKSVFLPYKVL